MKCEDIRVNQVSGRSSCKVCRENREDCKFEAPVKKRGPRPGWRQRARSASPNRRPHPTQASSERSPEGKLPILNAQVLPHIAESTAPTRDTSPSPEGTRRHTKGPLMGLSTALVDELLAVYFTHVHNVWPLIYKPLFHIQTTSPPLLLAMLAIASCVAQPDPGHSVDADKLFHMAERQMHHCRMDARIDLIQSLILLSLRQTGCGDKHMAFSYAGRACCMALNLGLNLAPANSESPTECEIRSRVYWNCYVLDKTLAEETGRSFLLPYRRSSTPLPSMNEADEFETWPPLPTSSLPLPKSVRHIVPRRGYVMSCFVWTCQLGMVVEDILDMDRPGLPPGTDPRIIDNNLQDRDDLIRRAETLSNRLDVWRSNIPRSIDVDVMVQNNVSPFPHHVVGVSWYYTAQILLLSRFIQRRSMLPPTEAEAEFSKHAHRTCSGAAEAVVDLLAYLDRHKLLSHTSADIIHILSLATLFEAFDSSDADQALAERAEMNFAQCCIWLRDCSASWPAASAHKLFFEGLIQGGLKLSGDKAISSPEVATSPSLPEGLRAVGRNLSTTERDLPHVSMAPAGMSNLFQLPQFYWNHLTNSGPMPNLGMDLLSPDAPGGVLTEWRTPDSGFNMTSNGRFDGMGFAPSDPPSTGGTGPGNFSWDPPMDQNPQSSADQAAIYSALMSFMVEAAKSH
ncbi:hypothetical protein CcaverHIS002_0700580 [Cutaneotrichosporon cavernicola]|uniref:Xylanolytic transcriptional activator regulatory domain-containing protein n=1 Tax=Cutaneotrichosporon cavernicola TaxID=279322 RepID=A0AA48QYG1_9TREE|nr:uncharacterized protein CcaverHIS019_0700590 [Cutaneotrichosporon cavernicola]BEI86712.1 hypothetical protein CcaverHIS002_0700580 [Cutaneotrichosporon cavernicola]BEI94487.1 hypothetical protein CcaverHIS019_0700590 [Cutaneotrichosporon cavernicola]BEJ02263.1 hypothetical protein CcaverHIS631_0700580 [Cutaneotrichosporon cavernicola]